jgi:hypothetical protein
MENIEFMFLLIYTLTIGAIIGISLVDQCGFDDALSARRYKLYVYESKGLSKRGVFVESF